MSQSLQTVKSESGKKYSLLIDEGYIIDFCDHSCGGTISRVYQQMCDTGIKNAVIVGDSFCGLNRALVEIFASEGYNIELLEV